MKLRKEFSLKVIIFTLVFILLAPYITLLLPKQQTDVAYASTVNIEIREDDVQKGIALFILITVVSKLMEDDVDAEDISGSDLDLLARLIHAESRGEPFEGQVAVGAVVINRVKSREFPNNIKEVVYQKGQFSPVANGQINLRPNRTAYRAAEEALNGRDPSRGALYFYNPKKARTLWWLSTRKTTVEIGEHVFAK